MNPTKNQGITQVLRKVSSSCIICGTRWDIVKWKEYHLIWKSCWKVCLIPSLTVEDSPDNDMYLCLYFISSCKNCHKFLCSVCICKNCHKFLCSVCTFYSYALLFKILLQKRIFVSLKVRTISSCSNIPWELISCLEALTFVLMWLDTVSMVYIEVGTKSLLTLL